MNEWFLIASMRQGFIIAPTIFKQRILGFYQAFERPNDRSYTRILFTYRPLDNGVMTTHGSTRFFVLHRHPITDRPQRIF